MKIWHLSTKKHPPVSRGNILKIIGCGFFPLIFCSSYLTQSRSTMLVSINIKCTKQNFKRLDWSSLKHYFKCSRSSDFLNVNKMFCYKGHQLWINILLSFRFLTLNRNLACSIYKSLRNAAPCGNRIPRRLPSVFLQWIVFETLI